MCVSFHEWIMKKYVAWRGDAVGNERSITEFASYIGVSQQLMSNWMKPGGNVPKSKKSIDALARVYGLEVYDVLGLQRPDPFGEIEALARAAKTPEEKATIREKLLTILDVLGHERKL
jgi:transcriptional regulator with XRE-family HTH domain